MKNQLIDQLVADASWFLTKHEKDPASPFYGESTLTHKSLEGCEVHIDGNKAKELDLSGNFSTELYKLRFDAVLKWMNERNPDRLNPNGTRLLVRRVTKPKQEKQVGGILIPDSVKIPDAGTIIGEVIGIGDQVERYCIGNKILLGRVGWVEVMIEDRKYLIIHETDVLALFE